VGPVAHVYEEELPKPLRNGLRNLLRNLMEPVNFINHLLQLRPGRALETVGRFAINSTLGVGGLFDFAARDPFDLEYRRNGFSNTLGYYGVGQGPFLVVPLVGATTLRDLVGSTLDQAIVPFAVGAPLNTPYYAVPAYVINSLNFRVEFDERIDAIGDSVDPYMAMRESYLCLREADIAALRDLPPPRDCSIAALMAELDPDYDDADFAEADAAADLVEIPANPVITYAPVMIEEPVIEFIAVPVVQSAP
jgi:phospholipid-binding lipoprotein MlaA